MQTKTICISYPNGGFAVIKIQESMTVGDIRKFLAWGKDYILCSQPFTVFGELNRPYREILDYDMLILRLRKGAQIDFQ